MSSAMAALAVRRGRKKSKTFGRFNLPQSHHSSTSSISDRANKRHGGQSISTISSHYGGARAFRHRGRYDTDLDRQRRRFLIYIGTIFLITGLVLIFVGVGAMVPMAQTVGLLLLGIGAVLCIIKVFCSEAHATEIPQKIIVRDVDAESGESNGNNEEEGVAQPLANIAEFSELPNSENGVQQDSNAATPNQNSITPTSPPNSIPETQVLIGNDSGGRY